MSLLARHLEELTIRRTRGPAQLLEKLQGVGLRETHLSVCVSLCRIQLKKARTLRVSSQLLEGPTVYLSVCMLVFARGSVPAAVVGLWALGVWHVQVPAAGDTGHAEPTTG